MARFPVYTDADLHGPIVAGLIARGWSAIRAIDAKPEGTDDIDHFELAVTLERVLIANDKHMKAIAERWIGEGRAFPGLIWWPRTAYALMSNSEPRRHRSSGDEIRRLRVSHRIHQAQALSPNRSRSVGCAFCVSHAH